MDFDAVIEEEQNVPAVQGQLDISVVMDTIKSRFLPRVQEMEDAAKAIQITDEATFSMAIAMGGQTKDLSKSLEKARKAIIEEPDTFVRSVNKAVKTFKDKLDAIEITIKGKINAHQIKLEAERREAERKAQEEARKLAEEQERARKAQEAERLRIIAEQEAAAKAANVHPPPPPPPVEEVAPVVVVPVIPRKNVQRADTGASVHLRKEWTHELEDISKVPLEYLLLNEQKVRQAIKLGIRNIPGVKIFENETTVLRS